MVREIKLLGKVITLAFAFFGIVLWLIACNVEQVPSPKRVPIECPQIQEDTFRSLEFGSLRSEPMRQWLEQSSSFKGNDVDISHESNSSNFSYIWKSAWASYQAYFRNDVLTRIWVFWEDDGALEPRSDEILDCLGKPDLYRAARSTDAGGNYIALSLWYLDKGIVVHSESLRYRDELPTIDGNVVMDFMAMTAPGTAEEMVRDGYGFGYLDHVRSDILQFLEPWPGSWEEVVIK